MWDEAGSKQTKRIDYGPGPVRGTRRANRAARCRSGPLPTPAPRGRACYRHVSEAERSGVSVAAPVRLIESLTDLHLRAPAEIPRETIVKQAITLLFAGYGTPRSPRRAARVG